MGRTRETPKQGSYTEQEILVAALVAQAVAEGASAGTVAALLAPLLVATASTEGVALMAARLALGEDPPEPARPSAGEAERRAALDNLLFRAFYAVSALKRLAAAGTEGPDSLAFALARERVHAGAHVRASEARIRGARLNDAAAEKWGDTLGWAHTKVAQTHRPEHEAAHGKNFSVSNPPLSTGGLPATLPGCDCVPRAPYPGAEMVP